MVAEFYIDRMCKVFRFSLLFFFASNVFCDNSNHYYIEMSNNVDDKSNNFLKYQIKDNEIKEVHQLKSNYGKNSPYNFGNNIRKDKYSNNKLNNPLLNTNNNGYGYTNKCCSCINCKTGLFSCKYNCLGNSCSKKRFFFTAGGFVILFGLGIGLGMLIYYLCLDNSRNNINIIPNSDNTTDVPIIDNTTDIPIIDNTTDTPTYIPSDDKYEEEEEIAKESESTDVKEDEKETCKEEEKETAKESEGTDIKEEEKETAKESEGTDVKEEEKETAKESEGTDAKEEEKETAKESEGTDVKEEEKETAKESEGTDAKEEEKETAKESEGTDAKEEE